MLLTIGFALLPCSPNSATPADTLYFQEGGGGFHGLSGQAEYLILPGFSDTIPAQIKSGGKKFAQGMPVPVPPDKDCWIRFTVNNQSVYQDFFFCAGPFDKISLFEKGQGEHKSAGLLVNCAEQLDKLDQLAIPISIPIGESRTFYARVYNEVRKYNNEVNPEIRPRKAHNLQKLWQLEETGSFSMFYAFFLGAILVFFLYSLSQYLNQRRFERKHFEKNGNAFSGRRSTANAYLLYAGYLFGVFLYYLRLAEAGNALHVLFAYKMEWYYYFESPLGLFSIFMYILFLHEFLGLRERQETITLKMFGKPLAFTLSQLFRYSAYGILLGLPLGIGLELAAGLRWSYGFYFFIRVAGIVIAVFAIIRVITIDDFLVRLVIIGSSILVVTGLASILWFYFATGRDFSTFNDILFFHQRELSNIPLLPMQSGIFLEVLFYAWALSYLTRRVLDSGAEARRNLEIVRYKENFYNSITHNFRTSLSVVQGHAELAREAFENGNPKSHSRSIDTIKRHNDILFHYVNRILKLVELQSRRPDPQYVHGDVIPYLTYLVESFQSHAEIHQLSLSFYSEAIELKMDYDKDSLLDIVSNLLSNAIKYTEPMGTVKVRIEKQKIADEDYLVLSVKDTGIGIPRENLQNIFLPFFQSAQNGHAPKPGSGIGLQLTQKQVELLGGEITVESVPGKGSIFTVWLPVHQNAKPIEKEEEFGNIKNVTASYFLEEGRLEKSRLDEKENIPGALSLLLVEDNYDLLRYYQALLSPTYRVSIATNGQEGLDKALEQLPDIIITDVMMPLKNGYELCKELKSSQLANHIPILMLTAKADYASKLEGLEYGADAYLEKPVSERELKAQLRNLGKWIRLRRERYQNPGTLPTDNDPVFSKADAFIKQVTACLEEHYHNPDWKQADLCQCLNISSRNLHRKFDALIGKTPAKYVREFRLKKAMELLKSGKANVSEAGYDSGFSSPEHFSRAFREKFGNPPSHFAR
ncbi:MAG: response regulator [Phaeodactylibacter sp.]|nr:response regulator [Phaeodactylibacter sp.]MCB9293803.1 response regulator [Lewinellaceae bacterium]